MNQSVNAKDIIFIILFSILIFFGSLFFFSSLKTTKVKKKVSIKSIEERVNKRVNKRIQKLQTRNRIFKSKINVDRESVKDFDEVYAEKNSKFELNVFESTAPEEEFEAPQTASEKIRALLDSEERTKREKEVLLEQYKEELVEKARERGWAIQINDDLEVISAKPL